MVDKLAEHPNQISKSPYQYAWNSPVNLKDPDGNCPWCIIGAVIGAAVDYGSQVALNYATGGANPWTSNISGASIVASAIAGAATGGLGSLVKTGAITTTRAVAGSMTVNAAESITKQLDTDGTVSPLKVTIDVAAGQIGDGIPTKNIVPTELLEKQLDRTVRVARNSRASRAEAVVTAQGKLNAANNINMAGSETTGEVVENTIQTTGGAVVTNNSSSGSSSTSSNLNPLVAPADNTRVVKPLPIIK